MDTLRVLVADDEMGMRLGVMRVLRDFKVRMPDVNEEVAFTVQQAETGEEALEIIRKEPPDILLLDHKMPGISGLDVLDRLSEMRLDMLTVMITAYASIETAIVATKRGAYDFLAKPFTPEELKSTIQKTAARLILAKQTRKLTDEKRQVRFEFIRVLGHELKAPLNAVAGYLNLIKQRTLGDNLADYDEMIDRSMIRIEGMNKLIHDLLDLTRIESGRKNRNPAAIDALASAQAAIDAVRPEALTRNISIDLRADGPLTIVADAGELEMIFNNLLSNAVKYNRDGGAVTVTLGGRDEQVVITVADTGVGMTKESIDRIFDEFVRIRTKDTAHVEGTGLGLSIVKKLVQLYGGEINVESQPDEGTSITVVLNAATS
jgi:two-component system, sensor histidine kinase and response regulator